MIKAAFEVVQQKKKKSCWATKSYIIAQNNETNGIQLEAFT